MSIGLMLRKLVANLVTTVNVERIKNDIRGSLSNFTVFTHIEPIEAPGSNQDVELDREKIIFNHSGRFSIC